MNDRNTARIRTALPQAWGAIVVYGCVRLGYVPDDTATELATVAIIPAAGALVYELARTLEARPGRLSGTLARILLGSLRTPSYDPVGGTPPPLY